MPSASRAYRLPPRESSSRRSGQFTHPCRRGTHRDPITTSASRARPAARAAPPGRASRRRPSPPPRRSRARAAHAEPGQVRGAEALLARAGAARARAESPSASSSAIAPVPSGLLSSATRISTAGAAAADPADDRGGRCRPRCRWGSPPAPGPRPGTSSDAGSYSSPGSRLLRSRRSYRLSLSGHDPLPAAQQSPRRPARPRPARPGPSPATSQAGGQRTRRRRAAAAAPRPPGC